MDKAKPDLMAATGARRPAESKRILAQLEHGARTQPHPARAAGWTIDGWTIGLFALLFLMCCMAWLMHDQAITPKTFRHSYSSSSSGEVKRAAPMAVSELPIEQAATIVNVATPASAADAGSTGTSAVARAGATPSPAATAARTLSAPHRPPAPSGRAGAAATASATSTSDAAPAGDTDVALLTALVAHSNKPTSVAPERSRDVVERQDGDTTTTAQLLARCKQLGLIEGMLCRSRICSGRWEADAACRAPNH